MAGHSQFKNIMYRKGAQDAKRAKLFAKLAREITVAAKSGIPEVDKNPRLRGAVINARAENMPKDKIEKAIHKAASGENIGNFEEVRYEGYGPGGVAVIVEALTDNRNRTASEIRAAFNKHGGNLGETGSVSYSFSHIGVIRYKKNVSDTDNILEHTIESGADDVLSTEDHHEIHCQPSELTEVRDSLIIRLGDPVSANLEWIAKSHININLEQMKTLIKMVEVLEDSDDVQSVSTNFEVSNEIIKSLSN